MKPLKKVNLEIERTNTQIAQLQEHLLELESKRTQLENAEIIAAIRNARFDANEMLDVIQAIKKSGTNLSDLLEITSTEPTKNESEETNND